MGAGAALATRLGADSHGRSFLTDLRHCGIACDVEPQRGATSGTCLALITPDAERTMSTHLGVNTELDAGDLMTPGLESAWLVYIEGYLVFIDAMVDALCEMQLHPGQQFILSLSDPSVVSGGAHRAGADPHRQPTRSAVRQRAGIPAADRGRNPSKTSPESSPGAIGPGNS